jgi:hypothetical protein
LPDRRRNAASSRSSLTTGPSRSASLLTSQRRHASEVAGAAEVAHDRGERGRDDGLVERGEQQAEQDRSEDHVDLPAGQVRWPLPVRGVCRRRVGRDAHLRTPGLPSG